MVTKWYSFFLAIHYVALSSRHDYGLFENFEIMKDSFLKEKTSTLRLKSLRNELHNGITKISDRDLLNWNTYVQIRGHCNDSSNTIRKRESFELRRIFSNPMSKILRLSHMHISRLINGFQDPPSYNYSMPAQEIIKGAQKGLIMLHETYDLNLREFAKGKIGKEDGFISRKTESLYPDDLASMSTIALNIFRWYDNSLQYLNASLNGFYNLNETRIDKLLPIHFETTLLMMKKAYSMAHNQMFYKKGKHIGSDWKLFPYLVNRGALKAFKCLIKYSISRTNIKIVLPFLSSIYYNPIRLLKYAI